MRSYLKIFWMFVPLLLGGSIYILFRKDSLLMFKWFESLRLPNFIIVCRDFISSYQNSFPEWFIYSLPDGLWLLSCTALLVHTWKDSINSKNLLWILTIPYTAIFSELGQLLEIVPGTFDFADIMFYSIGTIFPFIIFRKSLNINNYEIKSI